MNAFCWASFMIGSQICFNFWVKLAALLWQLRQELFQPFLAVLPLRPWDCHFQPFDNCTIGTFFAGNRFHRRPCQVIWFLIFNLPRQKCLHLQISAFAISEYLGSWKNMATVFASLKHPFKNILRGAEDNHDQSGLSLIISRVMVEKTTLTSWGDERTDCLQDENTADEHYADIGQSSVDYLRNKIQTRKIPWIAVNLLNLLSSIVWIFDQKI